MDVRVVDHPLAAALTTSAIGAPTTAFRAALRDLTLMLVCRATRDAERATTIRTPLAKTTGTNWPTAAAGAGAAGGLGMVDQAHTLIPEARVGFVGVARDDEESRMSRRRTSNRCPPTCPARPCWSLGRCWPPVDRWGVHAGVLASRGCRRHHRGLRGGRAEGITALEESCQRAAVPRPSTTASTTSLTSCRGSATPGPSVRSRAERARNPPDLGRHRDGDRGGDRRAGGRQLLVHPSARRPADPGRRHRHCSAAGRRAGAVGWNSPGRATPHRPPSPAASWRSPAFHRACASSSPAVTVICFGPTRFTTQGGRNSCSKATEFGWHHVIHLSWNFPMIRARYIFGRLR